MWPKKIKLLQFITLFEVGGTERQLLSLLRGLDSDRFELHLACLRRWGRLLDELTTRGVPISEYRVSSLFPHRALKAQIAFFEHVKQLKYHIVHTYGFYPNVFALLAARLAGVPILVASLRDMGEMYAPFQRRVQSLICRLADALVVNAETIKRKLIAEGHRSDRITVIPNGIDVEQYRHLGPKGRIRQELGVSPHAPLVGVIARLVQVKGIEYFLEAAAIIARRVPEARFMVVGEGQFLMDRAGMVSYGQYQQELEDYAKRLGLAQRVIFTGFRPDVPEILAELKVSVLPSLSEGLSNVMLESMAAGVPVVATRVGGTPEVVEDGATGLLVPPRDPGALAEGIYRLLMTPDLAHRFSLAGREHVAKRFSIERMVRETEALYTSLLEQRTTEQSRRPRSVVTIP